jgi:hypothetical protein
MILAIKTIENIDKLGSLSDLNFANNKIQFIGRSLLSLKSLKVSALSDADSRP